MTKRSNRVIGSMQGQGGQALIEILIAASFVLVPMLFCFVYLGKFGDLQHRAYEAARYAAWEGVNERKSEAEIANEINKRLLYRLHRRLDSEKDRLSSNLSDDRVDPLYFFSRDGAYQRGLRNVNGSYTSLDRHKSEPQSEFYRLRRATLSNEIAKFRLEHDGLQEIDIGIPFSATRHLALDGPLTASARNVMYIETWRKTSPGAVRGAIRRSLFGENFLNTSVITTAARLAGEVGFEEWDDFRPGYIAEDVVPCSRVVGGGGDREKACY